MVAFDPLHLGSDGGGGGFPYVFLVQHLWGEREEPEKGTVRTDFPSPLDLVPQLVLKQVLGAVLVKEEFGSLAWDAAAAKWGKYCTKEHKIPLEGPSTARKPN